LARCPSPGATVLCALSLHDALPICFPAGTVSGAPKVRAMEIIAELEPDARGVYAGAVGYLDFSGEMDTCIALRTLVYRDGIASLDRKSTRLNSSHVKISYAVFCLKK